MILLRKKLSFQLYLVISNCRHQITFAYISLLIAYPPPYHRLIWGYSNADILNIRKSISSLGWSHLISDNYIDIQASIFEKCVLNVFKSFVPNNYVVFDDKEPVWMDQSIKQLIKERDSCYSEYQSQGRRVEDLHIVTSFTDKINEQISNNRKSYFLNLSNQLKYTVRLNVTHRSRLEEYSWIYPKPLIRSGTRDFYSNLNLLESVES